MTQEKGKEILEDFYFSNCFDTNDL